MMTKLLIKNRANYDDCVKVTCVRIFADMSIPLNGTQVQGQPEFHGFRSRVVEVGLGKHDHEIALRSGKETFVTKES